MGISRTGVLYAEPSFSEGVARALDIGGTLEEYNTSRSGDDADRNALRSDWRAVGEDLREAIQHAREELRTR
jgi:hypothetical protein